MSAGADATRAPMLADALESMTHSLSGVPVIYARHLKEAAALLRRLAAAPANDSFARVDSVTLVHAVRRALEDNTPGAMDSPPRAWSAEAWSAIGEAINGHLRATAAALGRARPEPEEER